MRHSIKYRSVRLSVYKYTCNYNKLYLYEIWFLFWLLKYSEYNCLFRNKKFKIHLSKDKKNQNISTIKRFSKILIFFLTIQNHVKKNILKKLENLFFLIMSAHVYACNPNDKYKIKTVSRIRYQCKLRSWHCPPFFTYFSIGILYDTRVLLFTKINLHDIMILCAHCHCIHNGTRII